MFLSGLSVRNVTIPFSSSVKNAPRTADLAGLHTGCQIAPDVAEVDGAAASIQPRC